MNNKQYIVSEVPLTNRQISLGKNHSENFTWQKSLSGFALHKMIIIVTISTRFISFNSQHFIIDRLHITSQSFSHFAIYYYTLQLHADLSASFRNGCYSWILCIEGLIYSFGHPLPHRTAKSVMTKFGFICSGKGEIVL